MTLLAASTLITTMHMVFQSTGWHKSWATLKLASGLLFCWLHNSNVLGGAGHPLRKTKLKLEIWKGWAVHGNCQSWIADHAIHDQQGHVLFAINALITAICICQASIRQSLQLV